MPSPKKISKYDYNFNILKPEPPEDRKQIILLFVGREKQIERGVSILKNNSDVKGKNAQKKEKRPWVIHGESRIGKSHLARRIIMELPTGEKRKYLIIPARERLMANEVLKKLFEKIKEVYYHCINNQMLKENIYENTSVKMVNEIIDGIYSFPKGVESATITVSKLIKEGIEAGIHTSVIPSIVKLFSKFSTENSEGSSYVLKLRAPTPKDYVEYCELMISVLIEFNLLHHICILIDDVDLLEGYKDNNQNGSIERSILSDALSEFHKIPGVDVILTARSWYANSRKEFNTLIDLSSNVHTEQELVKIHDLRFKVLGNKKLPNKFLSDAALLEAASDARGMPGVFLQHLDLAFQEYLDEETWNVREYDWYRNFYIRKYKIYKDKCPQAAIAIENAIKKGELNIDVSNNNPFYQTIFDNLFVFQSYYQETMYYMGNILPKVIQSVLYER